MHKLQIFADPQSIKLNRGQNEVDVYWRVEADPELVPALGTEFNPAEMEQVNKGVGVVRTIVRGSYNKLESLLTAAEMTALISLVHYKVIFNTTKNVPGSDLVVQTGSNLFNAMLRRELPLTRDVQSLRNLTNNLRIVVYDGAYVDLEDASWIEPVKADRSLSSSVSSASEFEIINEMLIDTKYGRFSLTPMAVKKYMKLPSIRGVQRPYYDLKMQLEQDDKLEIVDIPEEIYQERKAKHGNRDFDVFRSSVRGVFFVVEDLIIAGQSVLMVRDLYIRYKSSTFQKYKDSGLV